MVGMKSAVVAGVLTFLLDVMSRGKCIRPGTRMPPSHIDALHCRRKLVDQWMSDRSWPWCGPLSACNPVVQKQPKEKWGEKRHTVSHIPVVRIGTAYGRHEFSIGSSSGRKGGAADIERMWCKLPNAYRVKDGRVFGRAVVGQKLKKAANLHIPSHPIWSKGNMLVGKWAMRDDI